MKAVSQEYVNALAFKPLYNYLQSQGVEGADEVLALAGLSLEKLGSHMDEVPAELYYQAYQKAIELTGDPLIGLSVGAWLNPSNMGLLGYTIMNCATVIEAFNLVQRGYAQGYGNNTVRFNITIAGDEIMSVMETDWDSETVRPWLEFSASGWISAYNHLTNFANKGKKFYREVGFAFVDNGHKARYEAILDCPVLFDQEKTYIRANLAAMNEKIHSADKSSLAAFMNNLGLEMEGESLRIQVQKIIKQQLPNTPSLEEMAENYHISTSTLKRRLKDEGFTYNGVCIELKINMAKEMLMNKEVSINDIAYYLGYSKASAFFRLFKREVGVTPNQYKAGHKKQQVSS